MGPGPQVPLTSGRAPDISQLSPQESAERLYNRVMLLAREGKNDSILFFAPMAIEAYRMVGSLDATQRYEIGRIGEVSGAIPFARAQADTILAEDPRNLLGLVLAARTAAAAGDNTRRSEFEARLLAAGETELAKRLPGYDQHSEAITTAIATARQRAGSK